MKSVNKTTVVRTYAHKSTQKIYPDHFTQRDMSGVGAATEKKRGREAVIAFDVDVDGDIDAAEKRAAKVVVCDSGAVAKTVLKKPAAAAEATAAGVDAAAAGAASAAAAACRKSRSNFAARVLRSLSMAKMVYASAAAGAGAPAFHVTLTGKPKQDVMAIVNGMAAATATTTTATATRREALLLPPPKGMEASAPACAPLGVCVHALSGVGGVHWHIAVAVGDATSVTGVDYLSTEHFTYACVVVPCRASVYVLRILPDGVPMLLCVMAPAPAPALAPARAGSGGAGAGGIPSAMELVGACLLPPATAAGHAPDYLHLVTTHKGNIVFCVTMSLDLKSKQSMPLNMRLQRVFGTANVDSGFGEIGRVRCILGADGMPYLGIVRRRCVTVYDVLSEPGTAELVRVYRSDDSACAAHAQRPVDFVPVTVAAQTTSLLVVTDKGLIVTYPPASKKTGHLDAARGVVMPRAAIMAPVREGGAADADLERRLQLLKVVTIRCLPTPSRAAAAAAAAPPEVRSASLYGVPNTDESPVTTLVTTMGGGVFVLHSSPELRRPQFYVPVRAPRSQPKPVPATASAAASASASAEPDSEPEPVLEPMPELVPLEEVQAEAAAAAAPSPSPLDILAAAAAAPALASASASAAHGAMPAPYTLQYTL